MPQLKDGIDFVTGNVLSFQQMNRIKDNWYDGADPPSNPVNGMIWVKNDGVAYVYFGAAWVELAGGGAGDVTAAAVLADHTLIRGDGGAKGIQDSGIDIDDADNITFPDGASINLQEDITFLGATTENLIKFPDNLPDAFSFMEGVNPYQTFITTDGSEAIQFHYPIGIGITPEAQNILHMAVALDWAISSIDSYNATDNYSAVWKFRRSHSDTKGTKTETEDGDVLGDFWFQGVDANGNFDRGASIKATQNGASGARVPTDLSIYTFSATGINTDQLHLLGNTGAVVSATQPAFLAFNSVTDVNVTGDGTTITVDFDTEIFDNGGDFAADTFTAPEDGKYKLSVCVLYADLDNDSYEGLQVSIVTSNRSYQVFDNGVNYYPGGYKSLKIQVIVDMDANDTAHVTASASGGAKTVDIRGHATNIQTFFSGALLIC